jgi:hypothetical protein
MSSQNGYCSRSTRDGAEEPLAHEAIAIAKGPDAG